MFKNFEKLNFINMSDVALAKYLRDNCYSGTRYQLNLFQALEIARTLKAAYKLGEIRGKVVK